MIFIFGRGRQQVFKMNQQLRAMASQPMNLILPNLYLGNFFSGFNTPYLSHHRIKAVLQVCPPMNESPKDGDAGIQRWMIPLPDVPSTDLYPYFYYTCHWIQYQLRNGHPVLIHCMAGVSRSATITIAYLMWEFGWSLEQTIRYVRQRRNIIRPNSGFLRQLKRWEETLAQSRNIR